MNLVLVDAAEPDADGLLRLTDRRARHLIDVLRVTPGRVVRVGVVDGPLGDAEVERCEAAAVELRCRFEATVAAPPRDALLLALPRPTVLARCLQTATALGFGSIAVVRTWHSDKAYLASRTLSPQAIDHQLRQGLEQAGRTHRPAVCIEPRFRPFCEDGLEPWLGEIRARFVAHLEGAEPLHPRRVPPGGFALAIGPERGFTAYEVDCLGARGFLTVTLGPHPLRVETALVALAAQLDLIRRLD